MQTPSQYHPVSQPNASMLPIGGTFNYVPANFNLLSTHQEPEHEPITSPGELTLAEGVAGGMGRHLGMFSCTMLIVGNVVGSSYFFMPSYIVFYVRSAGASLILWILGLLLSYCGLFLWIELGTMFPRSGGEKVYLEAVYKKPKFLATAIFAINAIVLGFSANNCIAFAQNILYAAGRPYDRWVERGIAIAVMLFVTILHGFAPKLGIALMNALSVFKLVFLFVIVLVGIYVLSGRSLVFDQFENFRDSFAGSSHNSNNYAMALVQILNTFYGWSNVNYVLNEVKSPTRTLKLAGTFGLGISGILYILANVAFFFAVPNNEIRTSQASVVSLFFYNAIGSRAFGALGVSAALFSLGSALTLTYSASRINQELAKEGIPLPFGNKFWASNWPTGKTPFPGLILHLIISLIIIIGPPPSVAYPFITSLPVYPQQVINFFVVCGLLWLRWKKPNAKRPFKVPMPVVVLFLATSILILVTPFIRPEGSSSTTTPLPYYLSPLVGLVILFFGAICWAVWRVALPKIFKYELVPTKVVLDSGTVVNVFSRKKVE